MSHDQPEPPKPDPLTSQQPQPIQQPSSTQSVVSQLQTVWRQVQPSLKRQSVKVLRSTIQTLEKVANKLEQEPAASPPITPPVVDPQQIASASTATPEIADIDAALELPDEAIAPNQATPSDLEAAIAAATELDEAPEATRSQPTQLVPSFNTLLEQARPLVEKAKQLLNNARPALAKATQWWTLAIAKIRTVLPASVNEQLSDRALSGIVAGILVVVLWTTSSLTSGGKSPDVTQRPESPVPSPAVSPIPDRSAPDVENPIAIAPSPTVPESPAPAQSPISSPTITPTPIVKPSAEPTRPSPQKLTPEQNLIAAIQDQVAEVTNRYSNGLVQAVQANFRENRLIVKVGDTWYDLSADRQDKLANEMLQRAQELDFSKLEVTDSLGTLLARSPIVGTDMVVLQRSKLPQHSDS